jgi:hypothetical protein
MELVIAPADFVTSVQKGWRVVLECGHEIKAVIVTCGDKEVVWLAEGWERCEGCTRECPLTSS